MMVTIPKYSKKMPKLGCLKNRLYLSVIQHFAENKNDSKYVSLTHEYYILARLCFAKEPGMVNIIIDSTFITRS